MFLLVPAHSGCPGQSPERREMVVVVVVVEDESNVDSNISLLLFH